MEYIDYDTRGESPIVYRGFEKQTTKNEVCETMKKIAILMLVAILSLGIVFAAEPGEVTVAGNQSLGEYLSTGGGNLAIQSGDVYDVNISSRISTFVWAGITGTVGGDIVLGTGTGAGEIVYNWSADGRMVFASDQSTIDWTSASIVNATSTDMPAYLTDGAADNWATTFGGSASPDSAIYGSVTASYVDTYDNLQAATWRTYSLKDSSNSLVWAGQVIMGGTLFNGNSADYQIIVPEDGTGNDVATTTYYLWAELV